MTLNIIRGNPSQDLTVVKNEAQVNTSIKRPISGSYFSYSKRTKFRITTIIQELHISD